MRTQPTLQELIEAACTLSQEERQRLLLALNQQPPLRQRRVKELRGRGKEVWQNRDAQEYIDAERDAWKS
jgi:hypothetical protein